MGCAINPGSVDKKNKIQIHQSALSECGHAFSVGSFQSINSDHSDTFEMKEKFYNLIESGNLQEMKQQLLDPDADIDLTDDLGWTGLKWNTIHYSCVFDRYQILQFILNYAFTRDRESYTQLVNSLTWEHWTPAMICCIFNSHRSLKIFLDYGGIDLMQYDRVGRTAMDLAKSYNAQKCIDLLISLTTKQIANLNQPNEDSILQFRQEQTQENSNQIPHSSAELNNDGQKMILINDKDAVDGVLTMSKLQGDNEEKQFTQISISQALQSIKEESQECREWIMNCVSQQINFADDEFPHCLDCLTYKSDLRSLRPIISKASWMRPIELFKCKFEDIKLFGNMLPSDIMIGQIHHHSWPAILSTLALHKQLIKNIFYNIDKNEHGVYSLKFYLDGKPREVLIDDLCPGRLDTKLPLFAGSHSKELWPFLLEKGYAKTVVNYLNTEKVCSKIILQELLPGPVAIKIIDQCQDFQQLLSYLKEVSSQKQIAIIKTKKDIDQNVGLIPNNSYSFIDIVQLGDSKVKAILLRNPFGSLQRWNGEFQHKQKLDEAILQAQLKYQQSQDQTYQFDKKNLFLMSVKEFYQFFSTITVSEIKDNFIYNFFDFEVYYRRAQYWSFTLPEVHQVAINIYQKMIVRQFYDDKYKYSPIEFKLFKKSQDDKQQTVIEQICYSKGSWKKNKNGSINDGTYLNLEPGQYIIRVKAFWYHKGEKLDQFKIVISTYSDFDIQLEKISRDEGKRLKFLSYQKFIQENLQSKKNNPWKLDDKAQQCYSCHYWDQNKQKLFILVQNKSQQKAYAQLLINSQDNIKISKSSSLNIEIEPNQYNYFLIKQRDLDLESSINWKIKYGQQKVE